jgi:hypothetical protein
MTSLLGKKKSLPTAKNSFRIIRKTRFLKKAKFRTIPEPFLQNSEGMLPDIVVLQAFAGRSSTGLQFGRSVYYLTDHSLINRGLIKS